MNAFVSVMNDGGEVAAPLLWRATWQGGLAILVVLMACRLLRSLPANAKCWLWRLAFVKLLLAGLWITPLELQLLPGQQHVVQVVGRNEPRDLRQKEDEGAGSRKATAENVVETLPRVPQQATTRSQALPAAAAGTRVTRSGLLSAAGWLFAVWLAGAAVCVLRLGKQLYAVRRLRRDARPCDDSALTDRLAKLCSQMHLARPPRLCVSPRVGSPCLVGVWRPTVLLPTELLTVESPAMLDAVLAHELAHVKRRDLVWNWLPAAAGVVIWFHPLLWLAKREWRLAQELATDELALSFTEVDPVGYAKSLVELVSLCRPKAHPPQAVGVSETFSQLNRRIVAMKSLTTLPRSYRLALPLAIALVAVVAILPWKLTAQDAEQSTEQPTATKATETAQRTTAERAQSQNNMKRIGVALLNYHDSRGRFPGVATVTPDESLKRLLSWRVLLLPYLGENELYKQFKYDQPWNSPHNLALVKKMPDVFASPGSSAKEGKTRYLVIEGPNTVFPPKRTIRLQDITDGTSNTISFVEASPEAAVPWTKPDDLELSDPKLLKKLVGDAGDGFLAAFADGSVKQMPVGLDAKTLKALAERADGSIITTNKRNGKTYVTAVPAPQPADPFARRRLRGGGYAEGGYGRGGEMMGRGGYGGEMGGYGRGGYGGEMMGGYGPPPRPALELALTDDGAVKVLGRPVPVAKLGPILAAIKETSPEGSLNRVTIRLPASTNFKHLEQLTRLCQQQGFEEIRLLSGKND